MMTAQKVKKTGLKLDDRSDSIPNVGRLASKLYSLVIDGGRKFDERAEDWWSKNVVVARAVIEQYKSFKWFLLLEIKEEQYEARNGIIRVGKRAILREIVQKIVKQRRERAGQRQLSEWKDNLAGLEYVEMVMEMVLSYKKNGKVMD